MLNTNLVNYKTRINETLTYKGVTFSFHKENSNLCIEANHQSQVAFSTSWADIGTLQHINFLGVRYFSAILPNNVSIIIRLSNNIVSIVCSTTANVWCQFSSTNML